MYYVRKLKNWKTITWDCSVWVWIALIIIAIVFFVLIYDRFDVGNSWISKIIPILLPYLLILLAWISFILISLKIRRIKNLKNNWRWILKKLKVTWIEKLDKKYFSWCYLTFKDGDILYCSNWFNGWICHCRGKYMEYNWILIKKWDVFDVYVDPDNPKKYWVDVDFLVEK